MKTESIWRSSDLSWLQELGWSRYGLARLEVPLSIQHYDDWLRLGLHGEMDYLVRHRDQKANPKLYSNHLRSALVMAIDYVAQEEVPSALPLKGLKSALYTKSESGIADYHRALPERLQPVLNRLSNQHPGEEFRLVTDSAPVLERDLARRAGLGWVGKNTCIIDRKGGSLFFLVEILSSLDTVTAAPLPTDHCGNCTRCLDACPTGALIAPRTLDARKCISYLTIESKQMPAVELRGAMGEWFFGCDICQTVCPWNQKRWGEILTESPRSEPTERDQTLADLRWILKSSYSQIEKAFRSTSLSRARGRGLKRNALIVVGNGGYSELIPEVSLLAQASTDLELQELAEWALRKINPS